MKCLVKRIIMIMAVLIMVGSLSVRAELITFDFSGEVVWADTPTMLFMPGQSYSGQFTFESNTAAVPYSNGYVGYENAITSFDIQIGDYYIEFLSGPSNIAVVNDIPNGNASVDHYSVNTSDASNQPFGFESNLPYTNLVIGSMGLDIIDVDQTGNPIMLLNESLPLLPPSLLDAEQSLAAISGRTTVEIRTVSGEKIESDSQTACREASFACRSVMSKKISRVAEVELCRVYAEW